MKTFKYKAIYMKKYLFMIEFGYFYYFFTCYKTYIIL